MKKSIDVKESTELELKFENGKTVTLVFDMQGLLNLHELPGGMAAFIQEKSVVERCAMIVYAAGMQHNEGLTMDEARRIVSVMDPGSVTAIMAEFTLSSGATSNDIMQEIQKKTMQDFLKNMK